MIEDKTSVLAAARSYWLNQLAIIDRQITDLAAMNTSGSARTGQSAEWVHDLRVAARRCQSIAIALRPYLPDLWTKSIDQTIKPLRQACDKVRDLDVLLDWLIRLPQPQLITAGLLDALRHERAKAAQNLADAFSEQSLAKGIRRLTAFFRKSDLNANDLYYRLADIAAAVLTVRAAEITVFQQQIDSGARPDSVAKELHRLRIAGKNFRYALEMLQPALQDASQILRDRMSLFQDSLGAIHDRLRFNVLLQQIAEQYQLPPEILLGLGNELSREMQIGWQTFMSQWQSMTPRSMAEMILLTVKDTKGGPGQ